MKHLSPLVALCFLAVAARAQLIVVPEGMALSSPGTSSQFWSSTEFHFQSVYDTIHFTNQGVTGPMTIHRVRFRAGQGLVSSGGQYLGDGATFGVNLTLGTSMADSSSLDPTFALNRLATQTVLTLGTVAVGAAAGGVPNDYVIDIAVPGGFVYDPNNDETLLIEVDAPAVTGIVPALDCSVSAAGQAGSVVATTQAATSGTVLPSAPVVLFDFTGPGGYPGIAQAASASYGAGCYARNRSFYERFAPPSSFDLAGTPGVANGILLTPDDPVTPSYYDVSSVTGGWQVPVTPATNQLGLAMGDDDMSSALDLSAAFTLPFVGGTTGVVHANANGYVVLGPTAALVGDFTPSVAEFLDQDPRLTPIWYDFDPSRNNSPAGVYFDLDVPNQSACITWLDVGEFAVGGSSHSFQVVLRGDGTIEFRWLTGGPFALQSRDAIVGFTPGRGSRDPGSRDLSATMPFATDPADVAPLTLAADAPPLFGTTIHLVTSEIPASAIASANLLTFFQVDPGVSLAPQAPGCYRYVDLAAASTVLQFGSGPAARPLSVPTGPAWLGARLFSQSAALVSGVNPWDVLTSNGVALTFGTVQN